MEEAGVKKAETIELEKYGGRGLFMRLVLQDVMDHGISLIFQCFPVYRRASHDGPTTTSPWKVAMQIVASTPRHRQQLVHLLIYGYTICF